MATSILGTLEQKASRVADVETVLARHAADFGSRAALLAAYATTLHTITSTKELDVRLRIKSQVFPFRMRQSDIFVLEEILLEGQYELTTLLRRDPVIIDAGANIGVATVWFRASYPAATIYAFEPEAENCRFLRSNTSGLDGIVVEQRAVGVSSSQTLLHVADHGALHSIKGETPRRPHDQFVECVRLDEYLKAKVIKRIDLLKLDVEGSELDVLQGLGARIQDVHAIVGEMHERMVDEGLFYTFLGDHGFRRVRKAYYRNSRNDGVHAFEAIR